MKVFSNIPIWLSMLTKSHRLSSLKWHTSFGSASNRPAGSVYALVKRWLRNSLSENSVDICSIMIWTVFCSWNVESCHFHHYWKPDAYLILHAFLSARSQLQANRCRKVKRLISLPSPRHQTLQITIQLSNYGMCLPHTLK